jgi:small acid-soluble spore protein (thioredoxin-like protein)
VDSLLKSNKRGYEIMKIKPDDRRDNVDKIQENISNTIENFNLTEDAIENTEDEKNKKPLEEKNERREEAINGMRSEIRDEAIDKGNGYK